jgi:hypothetical protein
MGLFRIEVIRHSLMVSRLRATDNGEMRAERFFGTFDEVSL